MKKYLITITIITLLIWACGEGKNESGSSDSAKEKLAAKFGLTLWEYENGIGPIKEKIQLGELNMSKAKSGEQVFTIKCTQCHKLDERYTGPALRDVTTRRSSEYIMNQILNPEEMAMKHPEAKKLLVQYANKMTFQNVTQEETRAILEYLRSVNNK